MARSNPIIEHCKDMWFGIYNCTYPKIEEHRRQAQMWEVKNFWNQVLDFNWHRQDKSPNWNTIAEDDDCYKQAINIE